MLKNFYLAYAIQLGKKKGKKEWWSHINDADFVRSYGTIACGNMDPSLFTGEGLELSEMCI